MATDARDTGLLALRLGVGAALTAHGAQKLFGLFGGHGLDGAGKFFDSIGFRPGKLNALAAGLGEAGGGLLLAAGLATPAAGAAAAGTMVVASSMHRDKGFFAQNGGYEYPAVLGLVAASLALGGPGELSLDAVLSHRTNQPWMRLLALASIAPAAAIVFQRRKAALATTPVAAPSTPSKDAEVAGTAESPGA